MVYAAQVVTRITATLRCTKYQATAAFALPSRPGRRPQGKLKKGCVRAAGVDDMPAMIVGLNIADTGHDAAQQMKAAHDQPQMLSRMQCKSDWK
jgi:hypothetical protein